MVEPRGHQGRVDQLEDRFVRNEEAASSNLAMSTNRTQPEASLNSRPRPFDTDFARTSLRGGQQILARPIHSSSDVLKFGSRFSRKALTPSAKSGVSEAAVMATLSNSSWVSMNVVEAASSNCFVA